jgi:hypothetical protein
MLNAEDKRKRHARVLQREAALRDEQRALRQRYEIAMRESCDPRLHELARACDRKAPLLMERRPLRLSDLRAIRDRAEQLMLMDMKANELEGEIAELRTKLSQLAC